MGADALVEAEDLSRRWTQRRRRPTAGPSGGVEGKRLVCLEVARDEQGEVGVARARKAMASTASRLLGLCKNVFVVSDAVGAWVGI